MPDHAHARASAGPRPPCAGPLPAALAAGLVLLALAAGTGPVLADSGLVARWSFDSGDGTDVSGNHLDLTPTSGVAFPAARGGKVAQLDGVSGDLELVGAHAFTPNGSSWSVCAWVNAAPGVSQPAQLLVNWYRCGADPSCSNVDAAVYELYLDGPGDPHWDLRDDIGTEINLQGPTSILDGQWHFLAGTWDSTSHTSTFYVDGVVAASRVQALAPLTSGGLNIPLSLGRDYIFGWGVPKYYFQGSLDDVRIYSRSLSPAEVTALFNGSTLAVGPQDRPAPALAPASPNPARAGTTIRYGLDAPGRVTLRVLDVLGREVRTLADGAEEPGDHAVLWDGRDERGRPVPGGVYFYRLETAPGDGGPGAVRTVHGTIVR